VADEGVAWLVELTVRPGKWNEFRDLTLMMVRSAETEPGTLVYQRHLNSHGTLHAYERYRDSDAAIQHLNRFAALYAERFLSVLIRGRCYVYGAASLGLKELLLPLKPVYLPERFGFDR
jgi:autoinducer 2-degrading protein